MLFGFKPKGFKVIIDNTFNGRAEKPIRLIHIGKLVKLRYKEMKFYLIF